MRVVVLTLLVLFTSRLAAPAEAMAQYHRLTDAIVVGGTLATAGSGAEVLAGGPEIGGLIEIPMGDTLRLRGEAAVGFWHFNGYPHDGIAGSSMRRHRLTVSVLSSRNPPARTGALPDTRAAAPASTCIGSRRGRTAARGASTAWAGVQCLLPTMRSRWLAGAEVQLHVMGQPKAPEAATSIPMLSAHVSAVLKYRLP